MATITIRNSREHRRPWCYDETAYVKTDIVRRTAKKITKPQFPKFLQLPGELRVAIWEFALSREPREPRLIRPRFVESRTYPRKGNLVISHTPPPLFWACREARDVAVKARHTPLYPDRLDFSKNIVFFSLQDYLQLTYKPPWYPSFPTFSSGPSCVYNTHEMAVEYNWQVDKKLKPAYKELITHCRSLTRLYLVVRCKYPTKRVIETVWPVAEDFCRTYSEIARSMPSPAQYPTPQIVILLKKRKYDYPAETLSRSDFLSKFTVVPYHSGAPFGSYRLRIARQLERAQAKSM